MVTTNGRRKPRLPQHGTYSEYVRHGCRCAECTAAAQEYNRKYRKKPLAEKNITHGKVSSYNAGCRCPKCARANREYRRKDGG